MKAVLLLAVLLGMVALSAAGRGYRFRDYNHRYDYDRYDYWGRRYPSVDHHDDHHGDRRDDRHDDRHESSEDDGEHRKYTFHIGEASLGAYVYQDEEGHAVGFEIDLLHEVCEHANKECYFIVDKEEHCWYSEGGHEYPGMGLMAGWYDACMGYFPTVERKNSFDFAHSFSENMKVALYYKPTSGYADHLHHLANRTIGFTEGWPMSQSCLDRQDDFHGEYTAVKFPDTKHMVDALMHDEVDAVLAPKVLGLDHKGLAHTEPYFECTTGGAAVMTRYGDDVIEWWNKAFDEMRDNGDFRQICRKASKVHGHKGKLYCA